MDNVKLLMDLYDAFGRGDIPAVLGAMSPDIKWYEAENNPYMPSGEAWVGPDAVLANLFMRSWERSGTASPSIPGHSTTLAKASSSKHVTPEPTRRRAKP